MDNNDKRIEMVARVVREYRAARGMTQERFAALMAEGGRESCTKMAVSLWEAGKRRPEFQMLATMAFTMDDWRREFALDVLAILRPGVFAPAGEIGRKVIGESATEAA